VTGGFRAFWLLIKIYHITLKQGDYITVSSNRSSHQLILLSEPERVLNSMQYVYLNKIDPRYVVCGRLFSTPFPITPPWSGLFFFASPEFLGRGLFSQQFCWEFSPQKNASAYFSPEHYTAMGLSFPPKNGDMTEAQNSYSDRPQTGRFPTC